MAGQEEGKKYSSKSQPIKTDAYGSKATICWLSSSCFLLKHEQCMVVLQESRELASSEALGQAPSNIRAFQFANFTVTVKLLKENQARKE